MPYVKRRPSSGSDPYSILPPLVQSGDNVPRGRPPKFALGTSRIKPFLQANWSDPIVLEVEYPEFWARHERNLCLWKSTNSAKWACLYKLICHKRDVIKVTPPPVEKKIYFRTTHQIAPNAYPWNHMIFTFWSLRLRCFPPGRWQVLP